MSKTEQMKASDLRIGNLVNGYNNKPFEFSEIEFKEYANGISIDEMIKEPIPITEQWLLDFGFEVENSKDCTLAFLEKDVKFEIYSENGETYKIGKYSNGFKHLYYIHQLQNLYHSLTGKELKHISNGEHK